MIAAILLSTLLANFSYPIPALDNCRDARECRWYCEIPANKPACWSYAQAQVLGDATESATPVFPITVLGNCQNKTDCKAFCDLSEHRLACQDYARVHHLGRASVVASLVDKAKNELDCDSITTCHAACERTENHDKCKIFALKFAPQEIKDRISQAEGLLNHVRATFGCTTKESCMQFCKDIAHRSACEIFLKSRQPPFKQREELKANCGTVEECKAWCTSHPDLCPEFRPTSKPERPAEKTEVEIEVENSESGE